MLRYRLMFVGCSMLCFAACRDDSTAMGEPAPLRADAGARRDDASDLPPDVGTPGTAGAAGSDSNARVPTGPLPDLVLDAAYLIDTTVQDVVDIDDACLLNEGCVTGLGQRRVVRFGSRTGNIGDADFLLGKPEAGNPYWTYDACHDTHELVGFAAYELFDANTGERVVTGAKNGFCMRDSEAWALEGGPYCRSYDCNEQGIGQGCADNYGSELQCQWIDITGLPSGAYMLRVTINANRRFAELDYANDTVNVNLEVLEDDVRVLR